MLKIFLASLLAFLIFLFIHFISFHFFNPYEKVKCLLLIACIGIFVFALLIRVLPSELWFMNKLHVSQYTMNHWIYPAFGILFYGFLFLGYLEFYFTADRSITFRMLMLADKQPNHSITQEQMLTLYDSKGVITRRFDDLTYGSYFELKGNSYHITFKGKIILNVYKIAIEALHLGTGEKTNKVGS